MKKMISIMLSLLMAGAALSGCANQAPAPAADINANALQSTIDNYNKCAANGLYYAVVYISSFLGTIAGVVTDYDCQVLDASGNGILQIS